MNLLHSYEDAGFAICEALSTEIPRVSDELYYWLRYRGNPAAPSHDRLEDLAVCDISIAPRLSAVRSIAPRALTDPRKFASFRSGEPEEIGGGHEPEAEEGTSFRGPQLTALAESLNLGMHCLLIGPTATGKSLCAVEAFRLTSQKKLVPTINKPRALSQTCSAVHQTQITLR